MADLSRYEMVKGDRLACRTCGDDEGSKVIHDFADGPLGLLPEPIPMEEINFQIFAHESDFHQPVFEDTASEVGLAAKRVSRILGERADAAQHDVDNDDYFRYYDPATAYRDGMDNGMGGATGKLAALLGPDVAKVLAKALAEIAEMDGQYDELIQDHNRKTCDDFTCFVFGHLVDIARIIDRQLG